MKHLKNPSRINATYPYLIVDNWLLVLFSRVRIICRSLAWLRDFKAHLIVGFLLFL